MPRDVLVPWIYLCGGSVFKQLTKLQWLLFEKYKTKASKELKEPSQLFDLYRDGVAI